MDKPNNSTNNKHKNSFLKFLPKAASAVSFQNPPFSPGRDHHHHGKSHAYKGFSGPINFANLPDEARVKPKNGAYESQEPTSPKISCMGQIKCKHKNKKNPNKLLKKHYDIKSSTKEVVAKKNTSSSSISKFFGMKKSSSKGSRGKVNRGATSDADEHSNNNKNNNKSNKGMMMPSLGQMRKFASGRETTLGNFDWTTAQIAPIDHDRECFSDEERRGRDDDDEDEDEDDEKEVIIPYSAPMLLGGGRNNDNNVMSLKPRKEVNLWKRRTMDPPPPLALKSK